jgi:hypothetical protein
MAAAKETDKVITPAKGNNYLVKDGEIDIAEINVKNVAGDYMLSKKISYDPEQAELEVYTWVEISSFTFLEVVDNRNYKERY